MRGVCCLVSVGDCWQFVVRCVLIVVRCLFVVCCLWCGVCFFGGVSFDVCCV